MNPIYGRNRQEGRTLKSFILSAAIVAVTSTPSFADDPARFDSEHFDWSGVYAGGHLSYGRGELVGIYDQANGSPPGYDFSDLDPKGWGIGAHVGYNHLVGNVLLGVEADITKLNIKDDDLYEENIGAPDPMGGHIDLLYSVKARLGITNGRWNVYGTAGVAWADYDVTTTNTFNDLNGSQSHTDDGWVAGAGVEYALNTNWILRGEYLRYTFDEIHDLENAFSTDVDSGDDLGLDTIDQIRFGVSYKF